MNNFKKIISVLESLKKIENFEYYDVKSFNKIPSRFVSSEKFNTRLLALVREKKSASLSWRNFKIVFFRADDHIILIKISKNSKQLLNIIKEIIEAHEEIVELKNSLSAKNEILNAFKESAKHIKQFHDFDDALRAIIKLIKKLMKVEICSLMLLDSEKKLLSLKMAEGLKIKNATLKVGEGIAGYVAKFKKPLLIKDLSTDKRFKNKKKYNVDYKTKSALSVPLKIKNKVIGVINVNNKIEGSEFTKEDLDLLSNLSVQLAAILENAALYNKTQQAKKELELLYKAANFINSTLNLDELLGNIIDIIPDVLEVETCSLMLLDEETKTLKVKKAKGLSENIIAKISIPLGEGISGYVAITGKPLLIKNIEKDKRFKVKQHRYYKTKSALSVPLKIKNKVIGVVNINNKKTGTGFTESDLNLLCSLADNIAIAIENASLYKRTQRKVKELETINKVSAAITSTLNLKKVLSSIIELGSKFFNTNKGSLFMYSDAKNALVLKVAKGIRKRNIIFNKGEGIAGAVFESKSPLLVKNTLKSKQFKILGDDIPESMICAPLIVKNKSIGVLSFERKEEQPFTKEDLEMLLILARSSAIAIENANLYKNLLTVYLETVQSLASAIEAKDSYTHGHSQRVAKYSVMIARKLGLKGSELETIRHTALLHDIGKIGIAESILLKPGHLTQEEFETIKGHPLVGAKILESIDFLKKVRDQLKYHHERYDGKGYPSGLKGEQIPLGARIIAVADTFDAMTSNRPYRKKLSFEYAKQEILKNSGTQLDPKVVKAFLELNLEENDEHNETSLF